MDSLVSWGVLSSPVPLGHGEQSPRQGPGPPWGSGSPALTSSQQHPEARTQGRRSHRIRCPCAPGIVQWDIPHGSHFQAFWSPLLPRASTTFLRLSAAASLPLGQSGEHGLEAHFVAALCTQSCQRGHHPVPRVHRCAEAFLGAAEAGLTQPPVCSAGRVARMPWPGFPACRLPPVGDSRWSESPQNTHQRCTMCTRACLCSGSSSHHCWHWVWPPSSCQSFLGFWPVPGVGYTVAGCDFPKPLFMLRSHHCRAASPFQRNSQTHTSLRPFPLWYMTHRVQ